MYYHIVRDGQYVKGFYETKGRAERGAAEYPGSIVIRAAGRAEMRKMGITVAGPGPAEYKVPGATEQVQA